MKPEEFNKFLNDLLSEMKSTLETKEQTYSSGTDRFHNFIKAGEIDDKRPIDALRGMQTKHRVAIYDFLNKENLTDTPYEEWREKIIDNINYYILMLGMVAEEFNKDNQPLRTTGCANCNAAPGTPISVRSFGNKSYCIDCGREIEI